MLSLDVSLKPDLAFNIVLPLFLISIIAYIDPHNADPKPFRWTKSADDILASIERFCRCNTQAQAG